MTAKILATLIALAFASCGACYAQSPSTCVPGLSFKEGAACVASGKLRSVQTGRCCEGLVETYDSGCKCRPSSTATTLASTTSTTIRTTTTRVGDVCVARGLLCGQRGADPSTYRCCKEPGDTCGPLVTSGGGEGHVVCQPGTSTTTSTTSPPSSSTSTTLPPSGMPPPYIPTHGDVGLHWTTQSQELLYNHQTGQPLNQADGWLLTIYLRGLIEPEAIEAASEIPSCATVVGGMEKAVAVTTDKFLFDYVTRPIASGGTYAVHGNYLWDLTHNEYLKPLRSCILADAAGNAAWLEKRPQWQQALDLSVQGGVVVRDDPTYRIPPLCAGTGRNDDDRRFTYACNRAGVPALKDETAGAVAARFADVPLGPAQCKALADFKVAHDASSGVKEKRDAFLASARTPRERMLFAIIFTGDINAQRKTADQATTTAALNAQKHAGFATWARGFHCEDGGPPVLAEILAGLFPHLAAHNLLAMTPGAKMRSTCPDTLRRTGRKAVNTCPWMQG